MRLDQKDLVKLRVFGLDNASYEAITYLADILYEHHARDAVLLTGDGAIQAQGAAKLALWLKTLPKGIRDGSNATTSTAVG